MYASYWFNNYLLCTQIKNLWTVTATFIVKNVCMSTLYLDIFNSKILITYVYVSTYTRSVKLNKVIMSRIFTCNLTNYNNLP